MDGVADSARYTAPRVRDEANPAARSRVGADPRSDTPRTLADGTVLRPLSEERGELEECVALQKAIWGEGFADVAAPQILRIVQSMGGVAAGAFDPGGDLVGFVFGITGFKEGRPLHWSHMLAVLPEARGRDLGYHLKLYQRERLLPLGIDEMRWTFDPLVSKNAYLNLVRLGARAIDYRRDYYGSGEDSRLSAGIGTDRFVVEWRLDREPPAPEDGVAAEVREAPVLNAPPGAERDLPAAGDLLAAESPPWARIEVPRDIHELRGASGEEAARWRASTRDAFLAVFEHGYEVTGFYRERAEEGRGLARGAPPRSFYVSRKAEK